MTSVAPGADTRKLELLGDLLDIAVPLEMERLANLSSRLRQHAIEHNSVNAAQAVAHSGDALLFITKRRRGKPPSENHPGWPAEPSTADVFSDLARGLAAAAYSPGGIMFAGRHWCVNHEVCMAAEEKARETAMRESKE